MKKFIIMTKEEYFLLGFPPETDHSIVEHSGDIILEESFYNNFMATKMSPEEIMTALLKEDQEYLLNLADQIYNAERFIERWYLMILLAANILLHNVDFPEIETDKYIEAAFPDDVTNQAELYRLIKKFTKRFYSVWNVTIHDKIDKSDNKISIN